MFPLWFRYGEVRDTGDLLRTLVLPTSLVTAAALTLFVLLSRFKKAAMASTEPETSVAIYTEAGLRIDSRRPKSRHCGWPSQGTSSTTTTTTTVVPWSDVLSAQALPKSDGQEEEGIEVTYARAVSKDKQSEVQPVTTSILLPPGSDPTDSKKTVQDILERAYERTKYQKRILVLVNPYSGKGNGTALRKFKNLIKPILDAARCEVSEITTTHRGHAVEIARDVDIERYDVIACCSGDGVSHEVFNGFAKREDAGRALAKVAVVQLPGGSGNGMSWNCFGTGTPSLAALRLVKGVRTPLDLVSVTHPGRDDPDTTERTLSFLSQAVGAVADCDLGTEHLRFLGDSRFALGLIYVILAKTTYPSDIALKVEMDDKDEIREFARQTSEVEPDLEAESRRVDEVAPGLPALKYGTVRDELPEGWELVPFEKLGNFYCGNMVQMQNDAPFFPTALPSDGMMDLVTVNANIPTLAVLGLFDQCTKNELFDAPIVRYRKVSAYRLLPRKKKGYISIDGESIPHAGYQAEVHRKLGTTLTLTGRIFEGPGIPVKPSK